MDGQYNVKRVISMFCSTETFHKISADRTVSSVKNIPLDNQIKYLYDQETKIYFIIFKNNDWMDDKFGDNDIIIINNSLFGDESAPEEDTIRAIARITNFAQNPVDNSISPSTSES